MVFGNFGASFAFVNAQNLKEIYFSVQRSEHAKGCSEVSKYHIDP